MKNKWYTKSFRRNLVDMHIPDWNEEFLSKFDSRKYIENLKLADVDTAYIYANSCVGICNWPTKVGHMHKGLGGKDIIKELTEGLKEENINAIIYINIWSKWAYENFPDWRCVSPKGQGSLEYMFDQPGRYGVCCLNSPYSQYVLKLVTELCENYDFLGLWVDMILWRTMCTCDHCRARYKKETGFDIPTVIDSTDENWLCYVKKREEWVEEFYKSIISTARSYKPDISVMCNSSYYPTKNLGLSLDYYRISDFIGGDFSMGRLDHSFECKFYNSVTANHPIEFLGSVMEPSLSEHSILKTEERLMTLMFSCLMNNGRYGFIDAIDPSGTLNPTVYTRMRDVLAVEKQYETYLESDVDFCADVGIYTNMESIIEPRDNGKALNDEDVGKELSHMKAVKGAALDLIERHILFEVLTRYDLPRLSKYKMVILPDAYVLSEDEIEAFINYVKNGGCIYASGHTGMFNENGHKNEHIEKLLGLQFEGETSEELTYIRPCEDSGDILMQYTPEHPLSVNGTQMLVKALKGSKVLAKTTLPLVHPEDTTKFASAISNPPGRHLENPAILLYELGKGRVIYSAGSIETLRKDDQIQVFINMLTTVMGDKFSICSNAPRCVEITMYEQTQNSRYVLNLLNFQEQLPSIPIYYTNVKVRSDKPIRRIVNVPGELEVPFTVEDGYTCFSVEKLDIFSMFLLEY